MTIPSRRFRPHSRDQLVRSRRNHATTKQAAQLRRIQGDEYPPGADDGAGVLA